MIKSGCRFYESSMSYSSNISPSLSNLETRMKALYAPDENVALVVSSSMYTYSGMDKSSRQNRAEQLEEEFRDRFKSAREMTDEEITQLVDRFNVREANAEKGKEHKAFVDNALDSTTSRGASQTLTIHTYFQGGTQGGGDLHIEQEDLMYYSTPLLRRLREDEYVASLRMSDLHGGIDSAATRVALCLISYPYITVWPTTKHLPRVSEWSEGWCKPEVLRWCLSALKLVQLKYPNSRRNSRPAYEAMHRNAVNMYIKAMHRWPNADTQGLEETINTLVNIFPDRQKMRDFNKALRMQYKMNEEVLW